MKTRALNHFAFVIGSSCAIGSVFGLNSLPAEAARHDAPHVRSDNASQTHRQLQRQLRQQSNAQGTNTNRLSNRFRPEGFAPTNDISRGQRHQLRLAGTLPVGVRAFDQLNSVQSVTMENGVNLDLGSTERNITLGTGLFANRAAISITVGGVEKSYTTGSQVTAAEYVAVKQALSHDQQKLVMDANGRAVAGSVDFNAITAPDDKLRAQNLVNPNGVTISGDFGRRSDFRLKGDLINNGVLYAYSSTANTKGGAIRADNISNEQGALISTNLPSTLASQLGSTNKDIDLELHAERKLTNYGTIESSGSLTLTAGESIRNVSTTGASRPVIAATNAIALLSKSIENQGTISSSAGDITIDSLSPAELNVLNYGGTISAQNGAINVRAADYQEAYSTNTLGGDLYSQELNINSGKALSEVNVDELTGNVNQTGLAVHLKSSTSNLNIGKVCLTGDPTFYNTAGSITLNGNIDVAEPLTIVASGNITLAIGASITAGDLGTNLAKPVTLIAGANIIATAGGANQTAIGPIPPTNNNNGGVTLDGTASATGGEINFANGTSITARSPDVTRSSNGGEVLLVAFAGSGSTSGRLVMNAGSSILTGGRGFGTGGNVTYIGNGAGVNALTQGINTRGGTGLGGGNILLSRSLPTKSTSANIVYLADGSLAPGSSKFIEGVPINANITINGTLSTDTQVTVRTNTNIITNTGSVINGFQISLEAGNQVTNGGDVATSGAPGSLIDVLGRNGGIVQSGANGAFRSNQVLLSTLNGSIGTNGLRVKVDADFLAFKADGGTAFIQEANDVTIGASQPAFASAIGVSTALSTIDVLANGNLSVNRGISNTSGDLTLATGGGVIEFLTDSTQPIVANNGNLNIVNQGTSSKTDQIIFNDNTITALGAAAGNVLISIGAPGPLEKGKVPKGIVPQESGGGEVFFGKKGITIAKTIVPTFIAKGSDLVFNNNVSKKVIVFNDAAIITADPPEAEAFVPPALQRSTGNKSMVPIPSVANFENTGFTATLPAVTSTNLNAPSNQELLSSIPGQSILNLVNVEQSRLTSQVNSELDQIQGTQGLNLTSAAQVRDDSYMVSRTSPQRTTSGSICTDIEGFDQEFSTTTSTVDENGRRTIRDIAHTSEMTLSAADGTVLFAPLTDTQISTPMGQVQIAASSVVLVSITDETLAVYNLDDRRKDAVVIERSAGRISLCPGRHLLITMKTGEYGQVNPLETISHRRVSKATLRDGANMFTSEFSPTSLLESIAPANRLLRSSHPEGRKLSHRMLKTIAVLNSLSNGNEPFLHHLKPSLTALAR